MAPSSLSSAELRCGGFIGEAWSDQGSAVLPFTDVPVFPFTSEHLATYLSLCPTSSDCVIDFGQSDVLLTAASKAQPSRLFTTVPHPAQDTSEKRKFVTIVTNRHVPSRILGFPSHAEQSFPRNAEVPRALVRDMYTKSWSAFDRLVAVVPPGGSIG